VNDPLYSLKEAFLLILQNASFSGAIAYHAMIFTRPFKLCFADKIPLTDHKNNLWRHFADDLNLKILEKQYYVEISRICSRKTKSISRVNPAVISFPKFSNSSSPQNGAKDYFDDL